MSSNVSIKEFSKIWWLEVHNKLIGAVVFIDDVSAECLHWDGGLFSLLDAGAVAVKALSPFEYANKDYKKAVFIAQATSTQLRTVREIIKNSDFTHCIMISTASLDILYQELNEGRDVSDVIITGRAPAEATKQLEAMLAEWIGKKQNVVEVVHMPIFTISPTNLTFLTPPFSQLYPMYDKKLIPDTAAVDLYALTNEERCQVRRLASSLNSMFDSMNLKEDVFYMGAFSSIVAGVLENSPVCVARRKNCTNAVSLILVDRSLDICGVTTHSVEAMLDKVMAVLPRFPNHATDVSVDMSPLCEANVISVADDEQLSPGCLYHANDESCIQIFDYMMNKSQKEVMFDIYNKLSKIDVQKSPGPKTLLKVTPQSVEKIVSATKGNYDIIESHLGILQQALALVHTLKSPQYSQIELIMNLEKQVLQNIATSRESTSVLNQVSNLIMTRKERKLNLERLLALLVHIYALAGTEVPFLNQHEENLRETLSVAIFEDHKSIFKSEFEGSHIATPEECDDISNKILSRLKDVGQMRKILTKYNSVLKPTESGNSYEYRGLLQQLIDDLVDTARPEIFDLKHRNEGIKDLIRSGFNILTSKKSRTANSPLDNSVVIIFVLGGITADECKKLHRSVITSGVDAQVIIGATKFVTPVEAMRDVLQLY